MEYMSVAKARSMPGLRLVLSAGVPGPWGEAAKAVLKTRHVAFTAVAQEPLAPNLELRAWTGSRNAPIAVYDDDARVFYDELIQKYPKSPLVKDAKDKLTDLQKKKKAVVPKKK